MIWVALEIEVALKNIKNKSHHIELKLGENRSACHPDSNGANDAQIQVCMLKI